MLNFSYRTIQCGLIALLGAGFAQSSLAGEPGHQALQPSVKTSISKHYSHTHYVKPGASVGFSHDLKGTFQTGQVGQFELTAREQHLQGDMRLYVSASKGLRLLSSPESADISMTGDTPHKMNVQFETLTNGRQFIYVHALANIDGNVTHRAYTVPVQVGAVQAKPRPENLIVDSNSGRRIMVMPATETINGVPVQ